MSKTFILAQDVPKRQQIPIPEEMTCPRCNGKNLVGGGKRYNQNRIQQRYTCKTCGTNFSNASWLKGKHSMDVVEYGVSLYLKGYSSRKVAEVVTKFGFPITHVAVLRWVRLLNQSVRTKDCLRKRQPEPEYFPNEILKVKVKVKIRVLTTSLPETQNLLEIESEVEV